MTRKLSALFLVLSALFLFTLLQVDTCNADVGETICKLTKPALIASMIFAGEKQSIALTTQSVGLAYILTDGAQRLTHSSMPSKRTACAFAAAASLSKTCPRNAPYFYAGAAAIGWSTVSVGGHTWPEVVAGAAVGYALGSYVNSDGYFGKTWSF
jgi:membrane-associated phospholipid phosphatase